MSIKKINRKYKNTNKNNLIEYHFDINKCKMCNKKNGCYKEGAKSKTYSIRVLSNYHKNALDYEKTDEFKTKRKERYKIEAKNGEMKQAHGFEKCKYKGLFGMQIQAHFTSIAVNIKRIVRLISIFIILILIKIFLKTKIKSKFVNSFLLFQ
jgi:hypothetical protein